MCERWNERERLRKKKNTFVGSIFNYRIQSIPLNCIPKLLSEIMQLNGICNKPISAIIDQMVLV